MSLSSEIIGSEFLKEFYLDDEDFKKIQEKCQTRQTIGEFYIYNCHLMYGN